MQGDRKVKENSNASGSPFDSGFGFPGSIFGGGKDPFDDPFFSRPFGSLFGSNTFSATGRGVGNLNHTSRPKGPVIEELDGDDNGELVEKEDQDDVTDASWRNRNPLVEQPEDQANDNENSSNGRDITYNNNQDKVEVNQRRPRSVSFQRVTYGGINGAYYTATASRRSGNDGVSVEERRQADRTTGQATHRISRGLHDKGHSVTRRLDSDGKVDTEQTLHNLNEDELAGFEQAWRSNGDRLSHGWNDTFDFPGNSGTCSTRQGRLAAWGDFLDPFRDNSDRNEKQSVEHNFRRAQSSKRKPKKVVTINID